MWEMAESHALILASVREWENAGRARRIGAFWGDFELKGDSYASNLAYTG